MHNTPDVSHFLVTFHFNKNLELLYVTRPSFDHMMTFTGMITCDIQGELIEHPPVDDVDSVQFDYDPEYLDEAMDMYCAQHALLQKQ